MQRLFQFMNKTKLSTLSSSKFAHPLKIASTHLCETKKTTAEKFMMKVQQIHFFFFKTNKSLKLNENL